MFQQHSLVLLVSRKEGAERIMAQSDGTDFDSVFFVMPVANASVINNTQDSIIRFSCVSLQ